MKKADIMKKLEEAGIEFNPKDTNKKLLALLKKAEKAAAKKAKAAEKAAEKDGAPSGPKLTAQPRVKGGGQLKFESRIHTAIPKDLIV